MQPLGRLHVRGFTSLRDVTLALDTEVTVLIGANGAGKSNLIEALELLGSIVDRRLQDYVLRKGGFSGLRFTGGGHALSKYIVLDASAAPPSEVGEWGYSVRLDIGRDDQTVLAETLYSTGPDPDERFITDLPRNSESLLGAQPVGSWVGRTAGRVQGMLQACRVYHFDDVGNDAPAKRIATIGDDVVLRSDAENIAAVLHALRQDHRFEYRRIVDSVKAVAPFFDDFVLRPHGPNKEKISLRWRQVGAERVFTASELSDGTLRFICLATALLHPDRPSTIVLDEPELGLHPFAIHTLAGMIRSAATGGRRAVVATQSVALLSAFALNEVAIVERENNETVLRRPDVETLAGFLDDYSLGELWEMNLLGARPLPESIPTAPSGQLGGEQ